MSTGKFMDNEEVKRYRYKIQDEHKRKSLNCEKYDLKIASNILKKYNFQVPEDVQKRIESISLDEMLPEGQYVKNGMLYTAIPIETNQEIEEYLKIPFSEREWNGKLIRQICKQCCCDSAPCYTASHIFGCYQFSDKNVVYKKEKMTPEV